MGELASAQENNADLNGIRRAEELVGWAQFLKMGPKYGGGEEYILIDNVPAHGKNPMKRGDEKRRDFEHGWEQCEFSPISCMLKRRRR